MASSKITLTHQAGNAFKTEWDGHEIKIDLPEAKGGTGTGPSPKALMLVSLAGCTGLDVVMILEKMRVTFSDLLIEVEGHLSENEPKIYEKVTLTYSVKIADKDRASMEKAVKLSQEKYCSVSAMFRSFAKLDAVINFEKL